MYVYYMRNLLRNFGDDKTYLCKVSTMYDASPLPPSVICFVKKIFRTYIKCDMVHSGFFLVTLKAERMLWEVLHEHQVRSGVVHSAMHKGTVSRCLVLCADVNMLLR